MESQEEYFYTCPHCFQTVSIIIDKSVSRQNFIEDCEVCCRPTDFTMEVIEGEVVEFMALNPEE